VGNVRFICTSTRLGTHIQTFSEIFSPFTQHTTNHLWASVEHYIPLFVASSLDSLI